MTDALIPPVLDLESLDIAEIKRRFAAGTLTSAQLVKSYLDRIKYVNNQGPGINAVRSVQPGAMGAAVAADTARAAGTAGGPLAGVPVLVSDTIDVAGLPTTGGSLALKDVVPAPDAALVTRLKAAGAIILGKANVTELNGMVSTGAPSGYGSLHGQVMNPYDMRSNLNSATGGAVAAAAAGLAAATVGVEADAATTGTGNPSNGASMSALVPERRSAGRSRCGRRSARAERRHPAFGALAGDRGAGRAHRERRGDHAGAACPTSAQRSARARSTASGSA